jgi:hypothetical protein
MKPNGRHDWLESKWNPMVDMIDLNPNETQWNDMIDLNPNELASE